MKIREKERHNLAHLDARRHTIFECTDSPINLDDDDDDEGRFPNKALLQKNAGQTTRFKADDSKPTTAE
jgi:hypothetical protein